VARNLSDHEVAAFRERLCAAAEKLFAERGPHAVTMRELARELRVSAMTPYRYFDHKDEILAVVRAAAFDRFAAELERAAATSGTARERATAVARTYLEFAIREPNAYKLMFDVNQPAAERFPDLIRARNRARQTVFGYMRGLVADGYIVGDTDSLGKIFWAMIHGLVMLELAGRLDPKPDFATLCRSAMQLLLRGGAAPAAASQQDNKQPIKQVSSRTKRRAS
jgi:AcrR family transcriptional regulator